MTGLEPYLRGSSPTPSESDAGDGVAVAADAVAAAVAAAAAAVGEGDAAEAASEPEAPWGPRCSVDPAPYPAAADWVWASSGPLLQG